MRNILSIFALACAVMSCQKATVTSNANTIDKAKVEPTQTEQSAQPQVGECGTLILTKNRIYLQVVSSQSDGNADRLLEPQDGATENILKEKAEKLASVCINADFTKPDPIMVVSVSQIREFKN